EPCAGVAMRRLAIVEEHFAARERVGRLRARGQALGGGEIFVEPDAGVVSTRRPAEWRHANRSPMIPTASSRRVCAIYGSGNVLPRSADRMLRHEEEPDAD